MKLRRCLYKASNTITRNDILHFFHQLSTFISAGLSLMQSLDILIQSQENKRFRFILQTLARELENGKAFHQALQSFPSVFDLFSCRLIRIGEQSGTLNTMLARVSVYQEKKLALRQQFKQALFYPLILVITAFITLFSLLFFIVPSFASLFEQFPGKIPWLTQALIRLSLWLHRPFSWLSFLLGFLALIIFLCKKKAKFIDFCQHQCWQLPYLRQLHQKILIARFARTLATALAAALPLSEALILASTLSKELHKSIHQLHASVNAGKRFYTALALNPLFPSLLIQMVRTGEESGTLDKMLEKFADLYEAAIQQALNLLKQVLEPLIIGILGVLIGGIVIAMYLPIFQLGTVM